MSLDSMADVRKLLRQNGGPAMKHARQHIMQNFSDERVSSQALRYFSEVTLEQALPVFPALIAISCETVGGNSKATIPFGEALILTSAAADIHDDVIDQSPVKSGKLTVLGKFNTATAIVAGDILLVQGFKQLVDACESLTQVQTKKILGLFSEAVTEICAAQALETQMRSKPNLSPEDLLEVIKLKAVVPELCMQIGAIIGNGEATSIKILGDYGRIYGVNYALIEEIVDLLDFNEFVSRLDNEVPPLPLIYAFQNDHLKTEISLLLKLKITKVIHKKITTKVLDSEEVNKIQQILILNTEQQAKQLIQLQNVKIGEKLLSLLKAPLKYIET
jgi:geranylgeranyl pyrophosphate synthase